MSELIEVVQCAVCKGTGMRKRINGRALREARKKAGLTLAQVAKQLGVSFSHLAQVETGGETVGAGRKGEKYEKLFNALNKGGDDA